jgi:hypothetical protein
VGWLNGALGGAINWLTWFFSNPLNALRYYLGAPLDWLFSLFALNGSGLFAFVRDCMQFWYSLWSSYRKQLTDFLTNPVAYTLAAIRDGLLALIEELLIENW